jgi:hypothetical protein
LNKAQLRTAVIVSTTAAVVVGLALAAASPEWQRAGLPGIVVLEWQTTGEAMRGVVAAWKAAGLDWLAAFAMGLDYLFMPAYAAALYFGALAGRAGFAPAAGPLATGFGAAARLAVAAPLLDAVENAVEMWVAFGDGPDAVVPVAVTATALKWIAIALAALAWAAGIAALLRGRLM